MNTQNKTAHNLGNATTSNPLTPLQSVARSKANLLNPAIGLNATETLSNISYLLTVIQELSSTVSEHDQWERLGLSLLIDTMQCAISYEIQQEAK